MSEETIINEEKTYTDPETGKFVKGNPGGGRPKGSISVVSAIKKKLEECPEGKEKTYLHYLVEKIMKKAIVDDDVAMIKDIINRVDGMPQQKTDITTDGESLNILGITYVQPKSGDNPETNTKATPSVSSTK